MVLRHDLAAAVLPNLAVAVRPSPAAVVAVPVGLYLCLCACCIETAARAVEAENPFCIRLCICATVCKRIDIPYRQD